MGSVNNISPTPSLDAQARLFEIANEVALKYAQGYQWSTWHSWDTVNETEYDRRYGIRAAKERKPVEGQEHVLIPTRKYLSVRSLLDEQPQLIHAVPVDGKWLATAVRIQVNFGKAEISMQIPNHDWIGRIQSKSWLLALRPYRKANWSAFQDAVQQKRTKETILLTRALDAQTNVEPTADDYCGIALMQSMAYEFGLENDVLNSMMHSVYRLWAPYRSKRARADSILGVKSDKPDRLDIPFLSVFNRAGGD
ncbi:hypothetical protein E8E11_003894 [Didymella keratinophila]|nr:hypothetical protein E8E11_003894 [Didymella keratinophila]